MVMFEGLEPLTPAAVGGKKFPRDWPMQPQLLLVMLQNNKYKLMEKKV